MLACHMVGGKVGGPDLAGRHLYLCDVMWLFQVVGKEIMPRPIMNVALTYDHRLIDGREAVTFLKRIKDVVEDPRRLLIDV